MPSIKGVEVASPREAIRVGAELSIIEDPDKWFVDLQNRNLTTHIYDAEMAEKIFQEVNGFAQRVSQMVVEIEKSDI